MAPIDTTRRSQLGGPARAVERGAVAGGTVVEPGSVDGVDSVAGRDVLVPSSQGPVDKPPLALTQKTPMRIQDVLLKDERAIGDAVTAATTTRARSNDKTWEPDVVLLVLSRFHAQEGEQPGMSPAEMGRALELGLRLPQQVLDAAARYLGFPAEALQSWITRRPWVHDVERSPQRDVDKRRGQLQRALHVDGRYGAPSRDVDVDRALRAVGLRPAAVSLMAHWSQGIVGVDDFLAQHAVRETTEARDGLHGFVLGASGPAELANLRFATETNLRYWQDGYTRLLNGNTYKDHATSFRPRVEDYMDLITASGEPVVFLLPERLGHGAYRVTGQEMKWLLDNPERMKNVTFVVGAYHLART